jgi:hypothetical protein
MYMKNTHDVDDINYDFQFSWIRISNLEDENSPILKIPKNKWKTNWQKVMDYRINRDTSR